MNAAMTAPDIGPDQYIQWLVQTFSTTAGPNDLAGFILPPVNFPFKIIFYYKNLFL